ncbi:peptidase [Sphingopyxis lindanitolerans]|uniref:Peptidase n=1 Tax=Sphingopyxis lindanitolerans TaxID=2054227 RepID=A0A2S8B2A2_9SPHN|nr:flavin reductase family protein [Sphingopyxis lindanitolerans]PQM26532.1 peptidase [Sphingopyxis lindanitolerans]
MAGNDAQRAFRDALGTFATGVTIATTIGESGEPVGVTANSFNSVSIDPPLVLWSLAKSSYSRSAFAESGHFAIHVLAATQEGLSNDFARRGGDKFAGVDWRGGALGSPVLGDYAALFECRTRHQYEGGDHVILVGEVIAHDARDVAPLLFHGGRYAERRPRPGASEPSVDIEHGRFTDDFLFYLISRAHFQTSRPTRDKLARFGMDMGQYLTLALLSMDRPLAADAIAARLAHTGHAPDAAALAAMVAKGLLVEGGEGWELTEAGRERLVETLAIGQAFEADLADHFTAAELAETKAVLRRIIELTGADVPIGWRG